MTARTALTGRRNWLATIAALGTLLLPLDPVTAQEPAKTIRLTIDYGDGVQKVFRSLPWQERMTVFGALQGAARHPRGIKFEHRGSGATTFVTAIDDVTNEGRGRNWIYEVNDKTADRSCGVFELKAGDGILWRFGKQQ
jgi:hypothetical protein